MFRRFLAFLVVFAATAVATVVVSSPAAQAIPYPPVIRIPILTASAYDPCAGASNIIGGRGFQPGETIVLIMTNTGEIGRAVAAADGTFEITVTIPLEARGSNEVTAIGQSSNRRAVLTLEIPCVVDPSGGGGGGGDGSGGGGSGADGDAAGFGSGGSLASTGAAIGGVVLLGVVLFGVGTALSVAGRRRRGAAT